MSTKGLEQVKSVQTLYAALLFVSLWTTSFASSYTPPTPPTIPQAPPSFNPKTSVGNPAAPRPSGVSPLSLGDSSDAEQADFMVNRNKLEVPTNPVDPPLEPVNTTYNAAGAAVDKVVDTATDTMHNVESSVENSVQHVKSFLGSKAPPPGFLRKKLPNMPWHKVPNFLTITRCLSIPVLVALFYSPDKHVHTSVLFAAASFTDWLDGYLARRWDITSSFGAFLDPVADKLMVSTCLILLAGRFGARVAVPTAIILAREIAVSALREWMAQRGERDVVKVGMQGKVKTALTMATLTLLLLVPHQLILPPTSVVKLEQVAMGLLLACTAVTVTSGSLYFKAAAPMLLDRNSM